MHDVMNYFVSPPRFGSDHPALDKSGKPHNIPLNESLGILCCVRNGEVPPCVTKARVNPSEQDLGREYSRITGGVPS